MTSNLIVVHNEWGTYSGTSAEEILHAFYAQPASEGMQATFRDWIEHNRRVTKDLDDIDLPPVFAADGSVDEQGCIALVRNMLEYGGLELGPRDGDPEPRRAGAEPAGVADPAP